MDFVLIIVFCLHVHLRGRSKLKMSAIKVVLWSSAVDCVLSHSAISDSLWFHGLGLPSSSVHSILQKRLLEWVALPSLPNPLIEPRFPTMQEDSLPSEPPGKPSVKLPEIIDLLRRLANNGEYPWDPVNYSWKTSQNLPTTRRCGRTFNLPEKVPMQRCHL